MLDFFKAEERTADLDSVIESIKNLSPKASEELKRWLIKSMSIKEITELRNWIDRAAKAEANEKLKEAVEAHREYVGKCYVRKEKMTLFPDMNKYYKIISERGENEYNMSALTFPEKPLYFFEYKASRIGNIGDYFLGNFDFTGIDIESVGFFCYNIADSKGIVLDTFKEITIEEYNVALDNYLKQLKDLTFYADHDRRCKYFPEDEQFKTNEYVKKDIIAD